MTSATLTGGRRFSFPALPRQVTSGLGILAVLVVWELLAVTVLAHGGAVPTPIAVVRQWGKDGWSLYQPNVDATVWEALRGFFWGNLLAFLLAVLVILVPIVERVVSQIAVASYCLPVIAVGPILTVVLNGDAPMVALSAMSVFFTSLIGILLGLRAADPTSLDLVAAYGGGRWQQLRRVRLAAALPSTVAALKVAAPSALLGAIIGEYLGRVDNGLGLAMTVAQQQLDVARTWGIALVAGAIAGIGYGIIALVARIAVPWARTTTGSPS
ncbi:ABC transporter permease [Acidothermaceae bacterium B102]|nr:ABC transporter permease [Acidothermaceae bacterium B102]